MISAKQLERAIAVYGSERGPWEEVEDIWNEQLGVFKHIRFKPNAGLTGPGWWVPVLVALQQADELMEKHQTYRLSVLQIKEKFGGLRIYTFVMKKGSDPNEYEEDELGEELRMKLGAIWQTAIDECSTRCEVCGEPGELRPIGWIATLCDKHYHERIGSGIS